VEQRLTPPESEPAAGPDETIGAAARGPRPDAPREMARLLDEPPVLTSEVLRNDSRLTQPWAHGGLRFDYMRGMSGHVVVACHSGEHAISWRVENRGIASRTSPRAFTLIPEGYDGHWEIGGPVVVSHVYLTQQRLEECADALIGDGRPVELLPRVGFEDPSAADILQILAREGSRGSACSLLFVEQAIDLLCIRLIKGHSSREAFPLDTRPGGLAAWQVSRVTAYMREHLAKPIGLDELAGLVGLSRFHFCTAFRHATGYTPHAWLVLQRIARARDLLKDPALSITEIALAVGYQTPSAFAARFRRIAGITPTECRRDSLRALSR
jgi:AraC family transcriptional regulator